MSEASWVAFPERPCGPGNRTDNPEKPETTPEVQSLHSDMSPSTTPVQPMRFSLPSFSQQELQPAAISPLVRSPRQRGRLRQKCASFDYYLHVAVAIHSHIGDLGASP